MAHRIYEGNDLARRVFFLVICGIGIEIAVMLMILL